MKGSCSLFSILKSPKPSTLTSTSSKLRKPALGLDQFIQRQRVLSFWREIVRATNQIPPSQTRHELRRYARAEFERNRHVDDMNHIRYLISEKQLYTQKSGKTEFDTMKRYIDEQAGR